MLNKILAALLLILFFQVTYSEARSFPAIDKTQIIVVGTVHVPTDNYDSDTLLNILKKINPDVILVECDSSYMTYDFQLNEDIKYSFPETNAITSFLQTRYADLRPYDITGRDNFLNDYDRRTNERNFFRDIEHLSVKDKLNNDAIDILNKILRMMNTSREMAYARSSYINSMEGSKKIDTINYYSYVGFGKLINIVPELSPYRTYWDRENNYWVKRNNKMVENIINFARYFEGKRIVVFCGFAHKNLLNDGLLKRASQENYQVIELREF